MKKLLLFAVLTTLPAIGLEYRIQAKLNVPDKTVTGTETIVWTNHTDTPTEILPLHLYMNAFANTESVFLRESGGRHRNNALDLEDPESFGYCRVDSVAVNGTDATARFHYLSDLPNPSEWHLFDPSELTEITVRPDRTIGVIRLAEPVPPGGSVTVTISFTTRFPRVFARTGYWQTFFMGGQWYPKPAVFQGKDGWNCHFFHLHSEFFADFADFTVTLDVPQGHVLGATGVPVSEQRDQGRLIRTYEARNVHDFAWTAWDHWKEYTDRWKDVQLVLLVPPGHEKTVARQFEALKAAMDGYSELCGMDYPYPRFTLVDPPMQAGGAGGMEYPMLVTGFFPSPLLPTGFRIPESVIVHEFGHNYFYGILASNEFEDAWMDEGMNSFGTSYVMERHYGAVVDLPFLKMGPFDGATIGFGNYKGADFPGRPSWGFSPAGGYSTLSYSKPEIYLRTLQNMVGKDTFLKIFHTYVNRFKFKHPKPGDFYAVVREVAGDTAADFIRRMVTTTDRIDYAISKAVSEKAPRFLGLKNFQLPEKKQEAETADSKNDERPYWNLVVVENRGDFQFPVTVRVLFEDDSTRDFQWDGTNGWHRFEFASRKKMAAAIVDPDRVYLCDSSLSNNARVLDHRTGSVTARIAAAVAVFVQFAFNIISLAV